MTLVHLCKHIRLSLPAALSVMGLGLCLTPLASSKTEEVPISQIKKQCRSGSRLPAFNTVVKSLASRPNDAELLACLAEVEVSLGRESAAIDAYKKSLAINPRDGDAWRKLGSLQKRAVAVDPGNQVLRQSLIETILHTGPEADLEEQIDSFLRSASTEAELELTGVLISAGQLDRAQPILIALTKAEPVPPEVHAQLGLILMEKADYENAVLALGHAAQAKPKESRYALALSEALLRWHHYSTAQAFLQAVKGDFGSLPQFQYNLAYSYYGLRDLDSTTSILTVLLKQKAGYAPALFLLGNCYIARGNLVRGEQLLRRAIAADGSRPTYYASLAQVMRYQGKLSAAFAVLQTGFALDSNNSELIFESALCHEVQGELSTAQEQLEKLVATEPGLTKAHRALARVYGRMGNGVAAEGERQKLAQLESKERAPDNAEDNR